MKGSILIIDDNEEILEFLTEVLEDTYQLHLAANGEAALNIFDNEVIHLIVSDIMMPGIDGFRLCQIIKSNVAYCHIPIILLTAKTGHRAHIEGLEVGADAYIRKPFSPKLLQIQISNLLDNRLKIKTHFASSPFEDVNVMAYSKTDEAFLKKLDDFIKKNMRDTQLDIEQLADHMHMSRPTFYRKIKALSALSPKELVGITRLKKAASLMAEKDFTMSEIAQMVGFSSQSLFSKNFQKYFNLSPMEYLASMSEKNAD